ncbi:shikimate kinase [Candidatus Woesearchaeota archaeon]|nr:shikimate kinase [Candidatus Woesearchaeota archaeon]
MNIALIGFRGAGKTTIGKLLSRRLDKKLISTDDEIEKTTKMPIAKFVNEYGWKRFREVEADIIEYVSDFDDCIFDTGGGIIMRNENIVNLKKNALIVLLTADIGTVKNRLKNSRERPALTKNGNFLEEAKGVMQEREARYKNAADYTIDTSMMKAEEACDLIMHYVKMELQ